ncbi:MAG: hypothetical protein KAX16_05765, partial [Actinomycetia bacterium]|nr:hypothetical protein [Actinomycetes bacterium]
SAGTTNYAGDPSRVLPAMDKACLMCHPADDEFDTGKGYSDAATEQKLCYRCHKVDSIADAPDVESQISKDSSHPVGLYSDRHSEDEWTDPVASLGKSNRHSECIDCHDMDMLLQGQGTPLQGIWGVSVTNGVPDSTPTFTKVDEILFEYELCFKCHSAYTTRPESMFYETTSSAAIDPQGDKAREFNPNNSSLHPIEGVGHNQSTVLDNQLATAGLTTSSTIKCSDCHNADETSDATGSASNSSFEPKGTHGSTHTPLLRGNYKVDVTPWAPTYDADNFELCFLCHDETKLVLGSDTNFYDPGAGYSNLHRLHLKEIKDDAFYGYSWVAICRNCHYDSHSNRQTNTSWWYGQTGSWQTSEDNAGNPSAGVKVRLVSFSPDLLPQGNRPKPRWIMRSDNNTRYCYVSCHGVGMSHNYTPVVGTDDSATF